MAGSRGLRRWHTLGLMPASSSGTAGQQEQT